MHPVELYPVMRRSLVVAGRRYLDIFNVMAYDYHGAFDSFTGHVAPLYLSPQDLEPEHEAYKYFSVVRVYTTDT